MITSTSGADTAAGVYTMVSRRLPAATLAAAGDDETIPRSFLVLADLVVLAAAFVATLIAAPQVQRLVLGTVSRFEASLSFALPRGPSSVFPSLAEIAWIYVATAPSAIVFMELLGGYRQLVDQPRARLLISCLFAPQIAVSFVTLALFALKISSESRVVLFTFAVSSALGLILYRGLLRWYKLRRLAAGQYAKNVLLIGQPRCILWMSDHFRRNVPANRFQIAGRLSLHQPVSDEANAPVADGSVRIPVLGPVEDLSALLVQQPIHEIIAIQSNGDGAWLSQVIADCDYFRVRLHIVPEALLFGNVRDLQLVFRSEPLRLPEIILAPAHYEADALFLKRMADVAISAALLVVLLPLFALIAIAIKLTTPHLPILYPWRVIGLKGHSFTGYKFTTMVADADERREDLAGRNEMTGPVFKVKNDPRVTPLGRFLRKYSLNELPQLWSVLKGDMSLVGPRPAFRHELQRYELWHKRKLSVKPGMTCLWQVSGRNQISDFDEWVRLDLQYIDEWSLWLDLRIIARTCWAVVAGTGS